MKKEIWFDMDGTIADLYGSQDWLKDLINENVKPYANAKPLISMRVLAKELNKKEKDGWTINIVSWLSKNGSDNYDKKVIKAKKKWLKKHLKSVHFTRIDIIKYGIPKENGRDGILFDDEKPNRENWNGLAFDEKNIIAVLRRID